MPAGTSANGDQAANTSTAAEKVYTQNFSKSDRDPLESHKPVTKSKPGITFAAQDKLPRLPIPELESSAKKYLSALVPLQSAREHEDTKAAVQEFLRAEGPELQEKLKKYAAGKSSYIEQFCASHSRVVENVQVADLAKGTTHT